MKWRGSARAAAVCGVSLTVASQPRHSPSAGVERRGESND
jgi:hypothetical protein